MLGLMPAIAKAVEETCYLNGKVVPCPEISGALGAAVIIVPVLFALLGLAMFVFWLMMLIHAAKHPIKDKALWIIILIIGGILGAIIYYFVVKKNFPAQVRPPEPTPTVPPPATPAM